MANKEEIAEGIHCAGAPCKQVLRIVQGGWADVQIISVELTTLDWRTGNVVPGSQTNPNVNNLHHQLLGSVRDSLGLQRSDNRPEPRIIEYGECGRGCYCAIPDDATRVNETNHEETVEREYEYTHVAWLSKTGNRFLSQSTGQVVTPQGHQHLEGPVQMNPGLSLRQSWKLLTRHKAKVKLKVKYKQYELQGTCLEYPVEGGFPV